MEVTPQEPPKQQQLLAKYNPRWAVEASRQAELVPKPRREEPARPTKPIQIKLRRKDREPKHPELAEMAHNKTTELEELEEEEEELL